jgi:glycosyltransferase involved in cell wall biosynthesis
VGAGVKPRIVLSGVNFTEMGPLSVFREALSSLAAAYADRYEIIALVHSKSLFDIPDVTYMEYPEIKSSWLKRLHFEYRACRSLSEKLKPYLWFAMHDMTPNVQANVRAVYCHNPAPFYPFSLSEALFDWKFGLFTLLYRFLYRINIRSNNLVVVQQDWLRTEFKSRYGLLNVVVAHPSVDSLVISKTTRQPDSCAPYRFFYPVYPRTFKNIEQVLRATQRLERHGFNRFELWLTMNGTETPYAAKLAREYSSLTTVRWLGLLPRVEVIRLYTEADCLLFPSKLETWGMPITEFKVTGKPILAADLPYAHETVGNYAQAAFFSIFSDVQLAAMMKQAAEGGVLFGPVSGQQVTQPFSQNWLELWEILLRS